MSLAASKSLRVIIYEGAGTHSLSDDNRFSIVGELLGRGFAVTRLFDPRNIQQIGERIRTLVIGNFGGKTPEELNLLEANEETNVYDLSSMDAGAGLSQAVGELSERIRAENNLFNHKTWKPWFPVIDYDRCTNCMQCLSFCLFGVYGVSSEQQIQVQNQDNCKTNCPACSRVCPEAAIMFPKYKSGPINGDQVSAEDMQREKMKVDISSLLGGDIYDMLRERSERAKSRFSKERDSSKALNERQKCLVKLQKDADIPPEVLLSLPSQEEIQKRAVEASAKAEAARNAIAEKSKVDESSDGVST